MNHVKYERRVFTPYTPDALTLIIRDLFRTAESSVLPTVTFARMPSSEIRIVFRRGQNIEFTCSDRFPTSERRDFFTNRWLACWPLFAAVKASYPLLEGACTLWVDDFAQGPGLAFCGRGVSETLIPDPEFFETNAYRDLRDHCASNWIAWRDRSNRCFWRGASTGIREHLRVSGWREMPRFKLCLAALHAPEPDMFDVAISRLVQIHDAQELRDIRVSGIVGSECSQTDFMKYRLSIDIDGNTCSWPGLFSKLCMGITTIKIDSALGWRQWYYDRLIPWKNFVPLTQSMDHLSASVVYLRTHLAEAEEIARQGRKLIDELTMANVLQAASRTVFTLVSRP